MAKNIVAVVLGLLTLASCQWGGGPPASFRVELDPAAIRQKIRGTALANIGCLFVTVTGNGITADSDALGLGDRDPQCLGVGVTSKMSSVVTTASKTRLTVAAGSKRLIRVMGVETTLASCDGLTLGALFNGKRPAIFEIARTETDLFVDKLVTINGTNDLTAATDIVAPCDGTGNVPGQHENLIPTGMRLAALYYFESTRYLRPFTVATDYSLTAEADLTIGTPTTEKLYLGKKSRTFYAVEAQYRGDDRPTGSFIQRFNVDTAGRITKGYGQGLLHAADHVSFSDDDRYAYVTTIGGFYQYRIDNDAWRSIDPNVCILPSPGMTAYFGPFFFTGFSGSAFLNVWSTSTRDGGNRCSTVGTSVSPISGMPKQLALFENPPRAYLLSHSGASATFQTFTTAGLTWTAVLPGLGGSSVETSFVVDKDQKVLVKSGGGSVLIACPITASGTINCLGASSVAAINPRFLQLDPFSQTVFYIESQASLKKVRLDANGTIEALTGSDSGTTMLTGVNDLLSIPIY